MIQDDVLAECKDKMAKAIAHLQGEFGGILVGERVAGELVYRGTVEWGFTGWAITELREGWSVNGEESTYWAMKKGDSFLLMIPKQSLPIPAKWLREILKETRLTALELVRLLTKP